MPKKFKNCSECGRAAKQKHMSGCSRYEPKQYPEFDTLVKDIVALVAFEINRRAPRIESDMPYKQQLVLERVIKRLQECV